MILIALTLLVSPTLEFRTRSAHVSLSDIDSQTLPIVVSNRTQDPIEIWHAGFYPNNNIDIRDEKGKEVPRTVQGRRWRSLFEDFRRGRDKNSRTIVLSGDTDHYSTPPLSWGFDLKAGNYRLVVEYWERSEGKSLHMRTSPLPIVVVP